MDVNQHRLYITIAILTPCAVIYQLIVEIMCTVIRYTKECVIYICKFIARILGAAFAKMFVTPCLHTVYPKKYAHGFVVFCFVVVMQSFIMNSHEAFIHIHQGCFAGTGAIVRLPQCQWSKPDGYGKISQYITTTKHSKAKTVCIFLGIYCNFIDIPVTTASSSIESTFTT